ncbi:MAG: TldD/PmbA family protein [Oscillospiraceae bacterium]|nr:TldD/PmbA family protein [Oscillospiraceae bacterium]
MSFSEFLNSRRSDAKALVCELKKDFCYVSILGSDIKSKSVRVDRSTSNISTGRDTECGFVIKLSDGKLIYEYSLDDIAGDIPALAGHITESFRLNAKLMDAAVGDLNLTDEPLVQSFCRPSDLHDFSDDQILDVCIKNRDALLGASEYVLNAFAVISSYEVSKLFVSENRELDQNFVWINGNMMAIYRETEKLVQVYDGVYGDQMGGVIADMPSLVEKLLHKAKILTRATPITPGVYDVITDPSITGLIAHEAFGHGVEMDQFVKDRALAKKYVGEYVASPICNMRDGAAAVVSAGSYFFDDDGVLAGDTQIIKDGILVTGISDFASAAQLGTAPTGNGRRESSRRKAYSRMTNTFFEKGTDKLEDMIASIEHGYMLFDTNNGMEDPKNWAIQCVAEYGIEIRDGKLTENYVSPVVMSGYVPDLLKSISMISDDFVITGSGMCGKGYKEWVRVSDGGPALKVKVKLG